jgi:hypothetical protein
MNIIDFPIERINEFLSDHSFVVTKPLGENIEIGGNVTIKVKLTGIKPMISVGDWKDFIEYTIIIEDIDDSYLKGIFSHLFAAVKTQDYTIANTDTTFYLITSQVNGLLRNFLKYFGIDNYVTCTRIIDKVTNIDPKYMMESRNTEDKYERAIRQVVRDIMSVFKHQKEGDYQLPEDIATDENDMVYDFPELGSSFTVNLMMNLNDDIETIDVDGEYYGDDDSIDIRIESNPNLDRETLEELYYELNELVAHELKHLVQNDEGYEFPKRKTKKSLKYYTQPHEIDAQIRGFKRRSQKERKPYEEVVISWFKRNQSKHGLSPKEIEIVINKLLGGE